MLPTERVSEQVQICQDALGAGTFKWKKKEKKRKTTPTNYSLAIA